MSTPASPSSSPSKGGSKGGEDELWEEAFAKMDEQEPLFQNLPETEEDARKVFEKFDDKSSHAGPILLVKGVPPGAFGDWLRRSELGLHKAERLTNGTVYVPQAFVPDHGILRQFLGQERHFPILNEDNASYLKSGSGTHGSQNPDVFWFRSGERSKHSRVLFEVGISQSLSDLRRRAYALCSAENEWKNLAYVVLVKRYTVRRVFVEIWKRIATQAGTDAPAFRNDQRAPQVLGVTETMEFVANAHAFDPGVGRNDTLSWQFDLPASCDIPACDDLLVGGAALTFNAQTFLDECEYDDPEEQM
jgi:hypothetical protein